MTPWWQSAVFYQIYPRSFADASGDGVGDLAGIQSRLDHLVWLGVDAIWLSPFFRSPMADFGYDVSDYCDVDPIFGTLADFDRLVEACHAKGLRVIIDWVPAHTSDQHPWFVEARSARDHPRRDWYVWRDPAPGEEPPNNWRAAFEDQPPAWTFDDASGQYYLHSFLSAQPDLNWANPDVRAAMHETLRFWLDRGVDGFRVDVVHNIGKDPALPDLPPDLASIPNCALNDQEVTHLYLREIRALLEEYAGDRMMVGEVFLPTTAQVATYYGHGDELHLAFNFPPLFARWRESSWHRCLTATFQALDPIDAWPTWVLSNHDQKRHRTRYGSEARARAATVLLLGLRGTPFLYMGEELGLEDAHVPAERRVDPGGRDGCRAPIPWQSGGERGWAGSPWLPWPPDADERSVERQRNDPSSVLHLYKRVLDFRRSSEALRLGTQHELPAPEGVLAWVRERGDERCVVALSFADEPVAVDLGTDLSVALASDGVGEGDPYPGRLEASQAVVLTKSHRST